MRSHLTIGLMLMVLTACGGGGGGGQTEALPGKQATFTVGGSVTGLGSSGVVLELATLDNNQTETLTVTGDNIAGPRSFTFALGIASGARYAVSVRTPPVGLGCTVQNGSSTMPSAAVTTVTVTCTSTNYTVGGSVTGLAGTGLILRNNGGDDRTININGAFNFNTALTAGSGYAVTVHAQPSNPWQTCVVSNGSGSSTSGNVTNITVNCTTNAYSVGGSVSGLVGSGLVLQINGGGNLPRSSNGLYSFNNIPSGTAYVVSVLTQPTAPNQTCVVANGSNTVTNSNVTNVAVTCTTNQYTIGGTVSGLAGSGLVLHNNGLGNGTLNGSSFSFPTQISGTTYNVTVFSQPSNPEQICTPTNNSGPVNGNVSTITVTCVTLPPMTVTASNPASGATNVVRTINPTIDFSVPLNIGTVSNSNVTLASAAGSKTIGLSPVGNRITVLPQGRLLPQTNYSLNVATTVRGQNGDRLANPFTLSFTMSDGQWLSRSLVETDDTAAAQYPKVAMNASGSAIATWAHGGTRILASRYLPETGTWSTAAPIASSDNGVFAAHIAIGPQGNAVIVWVQSDGMQQTLMQSRYTAATNTWTQPELLQFSVLGVVSSVSVAASGTNDAVVGWIYSSSGFGGPTTYSVLVSRYNFSTDTWTPTSQIAPGGSGSADQHLSLATNVAGNTSAVWVRDGNVLGSHYNAANNTWSSPITLDNIDPGFAQQPKVAVDANGNAIAVWYQNDGVQTNIYANRYSIATGQWGFASAIETNNAGTAIDPQVAMDTLGNAVAIWHQSFNGTRFDVVANRYSISSNSWGTAGAIETLDAGDAGLPQLAIDPIGNAIAVWKHSDGTRFNVMANRYVARTGQWGTAAPIESDTGEAGGNESPSVVLDSNGSGIAVWSQSDGTRSNIYSNRFE